MGKLHAVPVGQRHASASARSTVSSASGVRGQLREQRRVGVRLDGDRQQAVLERVVPEDVGERGADHGPEAEAGERPGRVLARGAAAEVVAGEQDLRRPARAGCVERRNPARGAPSGVVAPVGEQAARPGRSCRWP